MFKKYRQKEKEYRDEVTKVKKEMVFFNKFREIGNRWKVGDVFHHNNYEFKKIIKYKIKTIKIEELNSFVLLEKQNLRKDKNVAPKYIILCINDSDLYKKVIENKNINKREIFYADGIDRILGEDPYLSLTNQSYSDRLNSELIGSDYEI